MGDPRELAAAVPRLLDLFVERNLFRKIATLLLFALVAGGARAKEIHLDCARTDQSVIVDIDIDRRFLQMMWSEGIAEEYSNGNSYISGPDSFGEKQKVTYVFEIDSNRLTFGTNRVCLESGSKRKCEDQKVRNTLDFATGELKYDEGEEIAILQCVPAPPGRGF